MIKQFKNFFLSAFLLYSWSTSHSQENTSFSVQVGACLEKKSAKEMVAKLKRKGYEPYIYVYTPIDSKISTWYLVRIDDYADLVQAKIAAAKFKKKEKLPAWVTNTIRNKISSQVINGEKKTDAQVHSGIDAQKAEESSNLKQFEEQPHLLQDEVKRLWEQVEVLKKREIIEEEKSVKKKETLEGAGREYTPPYIVHAGTTPKHENQFQTIIKFPEDNLLVLKILLGRNIILTEAIIGYQYKDNILLPLGEFTQILEFFINTEPDKGMATGWFLREGRGFYLDLNREIVTIAGKDYALRAGQVVLSADDIWVTLKTLEEWFPISLKFVQHTMTIYLTSHELLPLEHRLEREKKQGRLGRRDYIETESYRRVESPYKPAGIPSMNLTYNTSYNSNKKGNYPLKATALISGDLLYLNSSIFISADNDDGLSNLRLQLGRKDLEGQLLGALQATEFSLGDVYTPKIPLVSNSQAGSGMTLSNYPLEHISEFDTTSIRGDIEPDWEVELYRNDVLLEFQRAKADGIYEFLDVPLLPGLNIIKLLFYGPFNQRREKIYRFLMHSDLLKKGRFYYRFSANQHNKDLIAVGNDNNTIGQKQDKGRYFTELEYGLTERTSIASNLVTIPLVNGRQNNYCSLGTRSSFGGVYGRIDITKQLNGDKGTAAQTSLQTRFGGWSIIAKHDQFSHNFVSETKRESSNPLTDSTFLRLNGRLKMPLLPSLSLGLSGEIDNYDSEQTNTAISNRVSLYVRPFHITHNLKYRLQKRGALNSSSDTIEGKLQLSFRLKKLNIRGDLAYGLKPDEELRIVTLSSDYKLNNNFSLRTGINHQLQGDRSTNYSFGLNKRFKGFILGFNTTYADNSDYKATLSVSTSIGPKLGKKKGIVFFQSSINKGIVCARVFLDENRNGRFDDQDIPLPGVKFRINRSMAETQTNDQGAAMLTNISPYRSVRITVDSASFEDLYWIAAEETIEVIVRPGVPVLVDFPVLATGEVEGIIYLKRDEEIIEASNVEIELVNTEGEVIKKTKTAGDGFYLFDMVPLGGYQVRVSEAQINRLKLKKIKAQAITLTGEEPIMSGVEFTLVYVEE